MDNKAPKEFIFSNLREKPDSNFEDKISYCERLAMYSVRIKRESGLTIDGFELVLGIINRRDLNIIKYAPQMYEFLNKLKEFSFTDQTNEIEKTLVNFDTLVNLLDKIDNEDQLLG